MKKILILLLLGATPFLVSAGNNECVNSNILAHYTPETMASQDRIIFYVPAFVPISTFEASLNGKSQAVQYKNFGFITRAKVVIPETMKGKVRVSLGAQSTGAACNAPLSFSFRR